MIETREFPYVSATARHRLAGRALDFGLYFVTLGIGWFIWNLIVWTDGQTPGHQVLKMRVYSDDTKKPASWGHMALRQFLIPFAFGLSSVVLIIIGAAITANGSNGRGFVAIGYLAALIIFLVDAFWILKGDQTKRLTDVIAKTSVLNETNRNDREA